MGSITPLRCRFTLTGTMGTFTQCAKAAVVLRDSGLWISTCALSAAPPASSDLQTAV